MSRVLGLAQLAFAKRNYKLALSYCKRGSTNNLRSIKDEEP
jgi:hypothetical protein